MNVICVIPARYKSTRLLEKPLADICGKPMIWWIYNRVKNIQAFSSVVCAIDNLRIQESCESYGLKYVMTRSDHPEHISRNHEVSTKIDVDYYVCVNVHQELHQVVPLKVSH